MNDLDKHKFPNNTGIHDFHPNTTSFVHLVRNSRKPLERLSKQSLGIMSYDCGFHDVSGGCVDMGFMI